jgi:MFS family permease
MSAVASRLRPYRALVLLGYACMAFSLAQSMLFPALPDLIDELDTNANAVAWAFTGFGIAAVVATPVMGRLGDMFGKRRMLVIAITAFTVGAVVSAVSSDIRLLVLGRVIAGIGGGIVPLSFSVGREIAPPSQTGRTIGILAGTVASGSAIGFVLGGVIVDQLSWEWIFWVIAVMGVIGIFGAMLLVPESQVKSGGRVDVRGAIVLGIGLTLPLLAISQVVAWGWTDPRTIGLILTGLAVLAAWVKLELHTDEPIADIASLRSPPVLATNLATLPVAIGIQTIVVLASLIVQAPTSTGYGFGLGATAAGLIILPGALLSMITAPASGAIGARIGHKAPLALGAFIGSAALTYAAYNHGSEAQLVLSATLVFGGFGLALAALPNLIIEAVPQRITGEAVSVNAMVTRVSFSLGVQVPATIIAASAVAGSTLATNESFRQAYLTAAGFSLAAGVTAVLIPRPSRRTGVQTGAD